MDIASISYTLPTAKVDNVFVGNVFISVLILAFIIVNSIFGNRRVSYSLLWFKLIQSTHSNSTFNSKHILLGSKRLHHLSLRNNAVTSHINTTILAIICIIILGRENTRNPGPWLHELVYLCHHWQSLSIDLGGNLWHYMSQTVWKVVWEAQDRSICNFCIVVLDNTTNISLLKELEFIIL